MALLLEDGSRLLLEDGSALLLEDDEVIPAMGSGSPDPDYTLFGSEGPDPSRTAWD